MKNTSNLVFFAIYCLQASTWNLFISFLWIIILATKKQDIEAEWRAQYKRYLPNCLPLVIKRCSVFAIMQDFCQSKEKFARTF